MVPRRRYPRTLVAAALMALMFAPQLAPAQQQSAPAPPRQIGNRTDYKELQPTTAQICGSGGKVSVDCSPEADKELDNIRRQIDKPDHVHPEADSATMPPSGTR